MKMNIFKSRRFKHGSLATIITIGFIVAIVLINVVASMLLERFPLSIDLTKDHRFELTQDSIDYVKKIDSKVTITVCADEAVLEGSSDTKQAYEIMKNYKKYSNKISIDFINLTKEPNFAKKYPTEKFTVGDIMFASNNQTKKISINDLFDQQQTQEGGQLLSSKAEQVMTSSLMKVTDKNPTTVSLLTGMDNVNVTGYKNLLDSNVYNVVEQNILTEDINKDAAFVILPQPAADLSAANVKKIEAYLDNDGKFDKSLVFVASPTVEVGPVLKTFLAQWGMEVGAQTIIETEGKHVINNSPFNLINQVPDEDFGKQLKSQQFPIVTINAKPIKVLFESSENRKTRVLTKTYDTTVLLPVGYGEDFDPSKQEQSSFNTMVIGMKNKYEGTTLHSSNVVVISSESMINQELMSISSLSNADAALSMTSIISPKKETVKIIPVKLNQGTINITQAQVVLNMIVFVVLIPLLILIAGLVVWIRRRHL